MYMYLCLLPEYPRSGHQFCDSFTDFFAEAPLGTKVAVSNHPKDLVDGSVRREGTIEDGELPL